MNDLTDNGSKTDKAYHYFYPEKFTEGLNISEEREKAAKALIDSGEIALKDVHTGSSREDPTLVLGEARLDLVSRGDFPRHVILDFDQTSIVYTSCDVWECHYKTMLEGNSGVHKLCDHELAGIFILQKFLKEHNEFDETTKDTFRFLERMSEQSGPRIQKKHDLNGTFLELEPTLTVQEDGYLSCTFSIGTSRLYKIKNLHAFYDAMKSESTMSFGKKTELQLGENYLSESAMPWYRFLKNALDNQRAKMEITGNTSYDYKKADTLPLYGERLDQFLKTAHGKVIQARRQYQKERYEWTVRDHDLQIRLQVTPDISKKTNTLEGVRITGQIPQTFRGNQTVCFLEDHYINCIPAEKAERIAPLLEAADRQGKLNLQVGRFHLSDFYRKILPNLKKLADVQEIRGDQISPYLPPEPVFTAYFDYEDSSVTGRIEAAYGTAICDVSDLLSDSASTSAIYPYRDKEAEKAVLDKLLEYLPHYDSALRIFFSGRDEARVYELLDHGLEELSELCEVRMTKRFQRLGFHRHLNMQVGISMEGNLLDLAVTSESMSDEELLDILYEYRQKKKYLRLKNGDFLKLDQNDSVETIAQMMEAMQLPLKEIVNGKMHLPAYRSLYLDKMLEGKSGLYVDRDRHFRELIKEFKTVEDADYEVPGHLKRTIRLYQKDGYRWLRTLDHYGFSGILADEMGLGKTLQVLAVLEAVHSEEKGGTSLVICPASLVFNWLEEVKKFAPSLHAVTVAGTASERADLIREAEQYDLLITSYDLLKRDIAEYDGYAFRFEIIDEAQYIKNSNTASAKAVKLIHAHTRYALTGTPIENRLSELWSIFDYLMPGFLYSYETFRATLELPIVKNEDKNAQERLQKMIRPFILRRRKQDVLKDLPDKIEEIRYAGMTGKQKKLYDAQILQMKSDISSQSDDDFQSHKIQVLAQLMRIRQICCDPGLCYEDYTGESAKTELCMELIRSLAEEGHKTLVFSQFTSMLDILEENLKKADIAYYKITGQTPKEKRLELVNHFNQDTTPVFLISLKAGGTGLNLTGADSVIHYDPWWNTAAENQATDRAHRIGQKKAVTVYKLVVKDTVEEKIVDLQNQKAQLAEDILSGDGISQSTLTKEELLQILS